MGRKRWRVLDSGGADGIVVRAGQLSSSEELAERLLPGAIVEEDLVVGRRLRYQKVSGSGPPAGWVSLRTGTTEHFTRVQENGELWGDLRTMTFEGTAAPRPQKDESKRRVLVDPPERLVKTPTLLSFEELDKFSDQELYQRGWPVNMVLAWREMPKDERRKQFQEAREKQMRIDETLMDEEKTVKQKSNDWRKIQNEAEYQALMMGGPDSLGYDQR